MSIFQYRFRASAFVCFLASVWLLLAPAAPSRAQGPVVPDTPEIAGYLYLLDPHVLDQRLPVLWRSLGIEELMPSMTDLLAAWTGDEKLRLATAQQPVVAALLRDEGGAIRDVVVFPEAGSANYLAASARKRNKEGVTQQGISLIGSKEAVAQALKILPSLKNLRGATHPSDFSLYLRGSLWKGQMEEVLAFLCAPDLSGIKPLLNLSEQEDSLYVPLAVPRPTPAVKTKPEIPFGLQALGRVFQDAEMVHLALESDLKPSRLTLRVSALPGTALARLFTQPAPTNPLTEVLYLPEGGALRAGASFDMDALDALIHEAVLAAGKNNPACSQEQLERIYDRCTRPLFLKGNGAVYLNEGGVAKFVRFLDVSCAEWMRGAVRNSNLANYQTDDLLGRVDRAFPATTSKADKKPQAVVGGVEYVTVLMPRSGRKDLERIQAMLSDAPPGAAKPEISLALRNTRVEEFTIDQFFLKPRNPAAANQPSPPEQAVLSACRLGNYLVLTSRYGDMKATMARILRLDPLASPLEAQKTFLDGAHAYVDLTLPGAAAAGKAPAPAAPAAPAAKPKGRVFQITARVDGGTMQVTAALP